MPLGSGNERRTAAPKTLAPPERRRGSCRAQGDGAERQGGHLSDDRFLSRWSRRKALAREGVALEEPAMPASEPAAKPPVQPPVQPLVQPPVQPLVQPLIQPLRAAPALPAQSVDAPAPAGATPPPPPLTLDDVAQLTRESDFSRFVAPGVDGEVKNAALKKLFGDPHFNAMDGLDIYIDDYTKPDPLPLASIRKMAQAAFLGLIETTPPAAPEASPEAAAPAPDSATVEATAASSSAAPPEPDEDADLRLQSHHAAGCGSAEDGAATDERRQS